MSDTIVIAGAGQAGAQAAVSLRQEAYAGRIVLIGDEPALPYQRPPLSKAYLSRKLEADGLLLRNASIYDAQRIELRIGARISQIHRATHEIELHDGERLPYTHLILATGARNRKLTVPGAELAGVACIRTLEEASHLRERIGGIKRAVVIGAGFIGLEFAAVARDHGIDVTVIEAADRPMARALSLPMSAYFTSKHRQHGVRLLFNSGITQLLGKDGHVTHVQLSNGEIIDADLVIVGIGVIPNVELAQQAGLDVQNGVTVDAHLATSDPAISAIGDCAAFPCAYASAPLRLESVQNAVDQARCVAARLTGKAVPYANVPWFWSDQYDAKLQIAGITTSHTHTFVRGTPDEHSFAVFCFRDGKWLGVESINRPSDHMAARKLLAARTPLTMEQVMQDGFELKALSQKPA